MERNGAQLLETILQTDSLLQRQETARMCTASLRLSIPTLVDKEDNKVNEAYAGWPDRLAIVDIDGNLAYYGSKGPGGFKPREVERWLEEYVKATD